MKQDMSRGVQETTTPMYGIDLTRPPPITYRVIELCLILGMLCELFVLKFLSLCLYFVVWCFIQLISSRQSEWQELSVKTLRFSRFRSLIFVFGFSCLVVIGKKKGNQIIHPPRVEIEFTNRRVYRQMVCLFLLCDK